MTTVYAVKPYRKIDKKEEIYVSDEQVCDCGSYSEIVGERMGLCKIKEYSECAECGKLLSWG